MKDTSICFGSSITITDTSFGTHSWSNGDYSNSIIVTPTINTTYTVTASNNECSEKYDVVVNVLESVNIKSNIKNIICYGENNGSVELILNGGTKPYFYSWSNNQTTSFIEKLSEGNYTVTIKDSNNCKTIANYIISQPEILGSTITKNNVSCNNICDGSISIKTTGGIAPYKYIWNNGDTLSDVHKLCSGNYTLTISDKNNCTNTFPIIIENIVNPIFITTSSINANCIGDCNGIASVDNVKGGVAPYTFKWSNESESQTITNLCPDKYYVTVSDSLNCNTRASVDINTNSAESNIGISADDSSIFKGNSTIIHLIKSNLYSYKWIDDLDLNQNDIYNAIVSPNQSKYFYAIITDRFNCSFLDSIRIEVIEPDCDDILVYIPNAFTPNDDNQNDLFYIKGANLQNFQFLIFNRWGENIFETSDKSIGWDGTYKGQKLPTATYAYSIELSCSNGHKMLKRGHVTLIR